MINSIIYETVAAIYYGQKRESLIYRDYSDGINLLYIELYQDNEFKDVVF